MNSNQITFAIGQLEQGKTFYNCLCIITDYKWAKTKIILTRPVVEAGENLGFLPGTFGEN